MNRVETLNVSNDQKASLPSLYRLVFLVCMLLVSRCESIRERVSPYTHIGLLAVIIVSTADVSIE